METKNKSVSLERIWRRVHFTNQCYVESEGLSEGLALWWMDDFQLDIRHKSRNMIRAVISISSFSPSWAILFVYAPPQRSLRRNFWVQIKQMALANNNPWVCIGDFNEIVLIGEKEGRAEC